MIIKNKKIIDIFFGSILLQIVFLLAYSVNFLFAQVSTSPLIFSVKINNTEINSTMEINEIKNIGAKITSTDTASLGAITLVNFIFDNPNTPDVDYNFPAIINPDNQSNWTDSQHGMFSVENGIYNFYTKAISMTTTASDYVNEYSSNPIRININNVPTKTIATVSPFSIEFINIPSSPLSGDQIFYAKTNRIAEYVKFKVFPGIKNNFYELYYGKKVSEFTNEYYFKLPTVSFPNGIYKITAIANDGTSKNDDHIENVEIHNNIDTTMTATGLDLNIMPVIKFSEKYKTTELSLSNNQEISIALNEEININLLVFKTRKVEDTDGEGYKEYIALQGINNLYYFNLDTTLLTNNTNYYIKAFYNGVIVDYFSAKINNANSNNTETIINTTTETVDNTVSSDTRPKVDTTVEIIDDTTSDDTNTTTEMIDNTISTTRSTIYPTQKTLLCDNANIKDSKECNIYLFELNSPEECKNQEFERSEECTEFIFSKSIPLACREKNITTREECNNEIEKQNTLTAKSSFIYKDCTKIGITDVEECHYNLREEYTKFKTIIKLNRENNQRSIECKEQNISNLNECERFMFKKYAPEDCKTQNIYSTEECDNLVFEKIAPYDCKKARITSLESCNELMFEKYNKEYAISQEQYPIECKAQNIESTIECKKAIRTIYLPKKCTANGIQDIEKCEILLSKKSITKECQSDNVTSRNECNDYLFNQFGSQKCEKDGINDRKECENHIFNEYISKINCEDRENWECKNIIIERYLGNISYKQAIFEKIEKSNDKLKNRSLQIDKLKEEIGISTDIIPLKKTKTSIKIIQSESSLTLNKKEELLQLSPIIIMLDSDQDGLPDDIEIKIGTDPNNKDTDQDGYTDLEEIQKGYNPNGTGIFENILSSIEIAIINNEKLEHPKNKGKESNSFRINDITNLQNTEGYILQGTASPNSTATIYIYSDLPVLITTKTDEYGNWKYEMRESLIDGEHEIYVTINDNTGKVVNKSKPFSLFIKQAEAVSVKDFLIPIDSSASRESDLSLYYYKIISFVLIVMGISMFLITIVAKKKGRSEK